MKKKIKRLNGNKRSNRKIWKFNAVINIVVFIVSVLIFHETYFFMMKNQKSGAYKEIMTPPRPSPLKDSFFNIIQFQISRTYPTIIQITISRKYATGNNLSSLYLKVSLVTLKKKKCY